MGIRYLLDYLVESSVFLTIHQPRGIRRNIGCSDHPYTIDRCTFWTFVVIRLLADLTDHLEERFTRAALSIV